MGSYSGFRPPALFHPVECSTEGILIYRLNQKIGMPRLIGPFSAAGIIIAGNINDRDIGTGMNFLYRLYPIHIPVEAYIH